MGLFDRAIKNGLSNALGNVVEKTVTKAVEPVATNYVNQQTQNLNQAAQSYNQAAGQQVQYSQPQYQQPAAQPSADSAAWSQAGSSLGQLFSGLTTAAENMATEVAKNSKVCPKCNAMNPIGGKFCVECGSPLPEASAAQTMGLVCPNCGTKNVGTKFCANCGTKLKIEKTFDDFGGWPDELASVPRYTGGGSVENFSQDTNENGSSVWWDTFIEDITEADLQNYGATLIAAGFRKDGWFKYTKAIGGVRYFVGEEDTYIDGKNISFPVGYQRLY